MIWFKQQVIKRLQQITSGRIIWRDQSEQVFGDSQSSLSAIVTINNSRFYRRLVLRGSIGAAESYVDQEWQCDNLSNLLQIIIANEAVFDNLDKSWSSVTQFFRRIQTFVLRNSVKRSRKNISAHYDLGNDFFSCFLDETKMYSCAEFTDENQGLKQAQLQKLNTICDKLDLQPSDHLGEIGSGWGSLAIYAAQHYGCKVTTSTISEAQYQHVQQRIQQAGLEEQVSVVKQDYRFLTGQFDKLVSIEMIEAVGHQYFPTYFSVCEKLLKPGGRFFLQAITINDEAYPRYKNDIDFIKAYIFPGGCLPSLQVITDCLQAQTTMQFKEIKHIGQHYATTLQHWYSNLLVQAPNIRHLGFSDNFLRLWEYYFCYCRAGFLSGYIDDIQALMVKK